MNATEIIVQQSKLREIAYGDYKAQFKILETIFKQRKECAKLMLSAGRLPDAKDFIDLCNVTIKNALCL